MKTTLIIYQEKLKTTLFDWESGVSFSAESKVWGLVIQSDVIYLVTHKTLYNMNKRC